MSIEITPDLDLSQLSQKDKIKLVRESDGLLIEILENETIKGNLFLNGKNQRSKRKSNVLVVMANFVFKWG